MNLSFTFQAVFEAVVQGRSSDVALDDITLTDGCRLADSHGQLRAFQSYIKSILQLKDVVFLKLFSETSTTGFPHYI